MAFYTPDQGTPRSQGVSGVHGGNGVAPPRREEAESGRHPAPSRKVPNYFWDFVPGSHETVSIGGDIRVRTNYLSNHRFLHVI